MRVGRINAIKLVPYKDVKALLRYFSIRGVAREASKEDELGKINALQPVDDKSIKQKINARNSLNTMVFEEMEKSTLKQMEKDDSLLSQKNQIEFLKSMRINKKISKINSLDMLDRASIKNNILSYKDNISNNENNLEFSYKNEIKNKDVKKDEQKSQENIKSVDEKKENQEVKEKSLIEKYADLLEEIDKKQAEKEEKEKNNI